MTIKTACSLARLYARRSIAEATRFLIRAGLSLNNAARYVLSFLRAQRVAA